MNIILLDDEIMENVVGGMGRVDDGRGYVVDHFQGIDAKVVVIDNLLFYDLQRAQKGDTSFGLAEFIPSYDPSKLGLIDVAMLGAPRDRFPRDTSQFAGR